ncbi:hypothetical protein ILYODFUR_017595 [Ilyodon furcidens]|uniref:Uncharacterized protein n=1 Tax=Ilyodon furcidens TaxID=33524 RepID=A0ABV0SM10_9TELE
MMIARNGHSVPSPGRGSLGPHPGARPAGGARWRVPGGRAFTHEPRTGTPKEETWVPLPMDSPPMGGAKGVECNVLWVVAEGGDLGGLILGCRSCLLGRGAGDR